MSTRQRGNRRENDFGAMANALGYVSFFSRGSRGVDVVCIPQTKDAPLPIIVAEVGGTTKPIASSLECLHAAARPIGSLCVVARQIKVRSNLTRWRFNTSVDDGFDSLVDALESERLS